MTDPRSAIKRRDTALKNAVALFKRFECGQLSDSEFQNSIVEFLKAQTECNQVWMNKYIAAMEDAAQTSLDPTARLDLAFAATSLLIDLCAEGLRRTKGKRGKGPHKLEAARFLILRLEQIYKRATGAKATISTANSLSVSQETLSGPYPEFLRQADHVFRKVTADSNCKWPQSLPGFAKEMRRKARKSVTLAASENRAFGQL
jgi:hypothetical protein